MTDRRQTILVLVVAALVAFSFQGTRHLWDPDEGRYSDVAHQMLDLGDWIVPRLDPERPHFTKPPMTYWTVAASLRALGSDEWAARLPNALAFVLTALLVMQIARHLGMSNPAFAAGLWATLVGPVAAANALTTDTLLTLFETLAVAGFVASGLVEDDGRPRAGALRVMWAGFALAFLTKGPPGLLPLAAIVTFTAWRRRRHLGRLFEPLGLGLFAIIGLGWYVALIWRSPDLLHYFLVHETVGRVATGEHHRNAGWLGWLYVYAPTFLVGSLPWLAIVPVRGARRDATGVAVAGLTPDARWFLGLWFLVPLAVFVLARSRLPLYVLPLFVPLGLALAQRLTPWLGHGRRCVMALLAAAILAVALKGVAAYLPSEDDAHDLAVELRQRIDLAGIDELVFVDTAARYGLKHYIGLDVEQIETKPGTIGTGGYSPPEPLCAELATPDGLLLFVPERRLAAFDEAVTGCPHRIERLGSLRKWVLFRSLPDAAP
jgi:4-amino-4-deoxy-L-arabinose transferase-like glycosyltransferase